MTTINGICTGCASSLDRPGDKCSLCEFEDACAAEGHQSRSRKTRETCETCAHACVAGCHSPCSECSSSYMHGEKTLWQPKPAAETDRSDKAGHHTVTVESPDYFLGELTRLVSNSSLDLARIADMLERIWRRGNDRT